MNRSRLTRVNGHQASLVHKSVRSIIKFCLIISLRLYNLWLCIIIWFCKRLVYFLERLFYRWFFESRAYLGLTTCHICSRIINTLKWIIYVLLAIFFIVIGAASLSAEIANYPLVLQIATINSLLNLFIVLNLFEIQILKIIERISLFAITKIQSNLVGIVHNLQNTRLRVFNGRACTSFIFLRHR